jgi:phenylacetate-CoA ligase
MKAPVRWVPFQLWAGRAYRATLARAAQFDSADRATIRALQACDLRRMLDYAVEQVPAYRPLREKVHRLGPFEALKEFPLIDKDSLQHDRTQYLPRDFESIPHYECTTGGTTGNQLKFYLENDSQSVEIAFMHRQWARVGYSPRSRKATFRGVEFRNLRDSVYWQENPIYNELQFSPFHMSEKTLAAYVDRMFRYRPHFLHGYPSAIALLAGYVTRHGIDMRPLGLGAILLGSEGIEPGQREAIAKAFSARPYSWYGHSERLILGGECETSEAYHHIPDYGILEIIDDEGSPVTEPGQEGELVGTSLRNRAMPLIRYRTGDRARLLEARCTCGRQFERFDRVQGRWQQEYVIGKSGSRISIAALNVHGPFYDKVLRYQYVQRRPGVMELRLMTESGFSDGDMENLKRAFSVRAGAELDVMIARVDNIPLTARGKLRRLLQEIPPQG